MSFYDQLIDNFSEQVERKDPAAAPQKGQRPLKMPKNYDFSVRNVDWRQYKKDFLLRTDAVWEKQKLKDLFHTHYKVTPHSILPCFSSPQAKLPFPSPFLF